MIKVISVAVVIMMLLACGEQDDSQENIQEESSCREFELVDSIGIELGDSAYVFGAIEDVVILSDGNILVLDGKYCNLRTFSPQGGLLRMTGRKGEGPGELIQPINLYYWGDGTVGVMDYHRGGLNRFSMEGEWLGLDIEITQNVHVDPIIMADSEFVCSKSDFEIDGDQVFVTTMVARFPLSHTPDITYWEKTVLWDPANLANLTLELFFYNSYTADNQTGRVYVAPFDNDRYRINCYNADGSLFGTVERECTPVAKTEEEIQEEKDFIAFLVGSDEGGNPDFNYQCTPYPNHLPVTGLFVDSDGLLWARRGGTSVPTFDIWNEDLELVGTAAIPGIDGDGSNYSFVFARDFIVCWNENPDGYQKLYILEPQL